MKYVIALVLIATSTGGMAQYFQFSQYNFSPQRINPALVASSDYALLNFVYRNQSTDGGFHLSSNLLNVSYPLASREGGRWSGIGISLMDDRSGQAGIFNTQEVALSYAVNVNVAKFQSLSLGVKVLYQASKIDLGGLYTGSQYIPDRGFDQSISSGENITELKNNFVTFSAGLHWLKTDIKGINVAYWGISFFDINKPDNSYTSSGSSLNTTFVAAAGFRIYHKGNMSIYPEVLYTRSATNNVINTGAIFRCDLKPVSTKEVPHVDMITKYIIGRSGLLGMQYHNERFSIGFSYDFPFFYRNVANIGTVEVGLTLKKLVISPRRKKSTEKNGADVTGQVTPRQGKKLGASVGVKLPAVKKAQSDSISHRSAVPSTDLSARLKQKQDSIIVQANAGKINHEPLVLEKATLYFNFEFNSSALDRDATVYLDGLVKALLDNPELKIRLVGHTDNIGSEKFNMKLSLHRAESLKDHLVQHGVPPSRVSVEGKGMNEPLTGNETEDERAKNRR
ncbi:MAG TPA: PorP/SprF family type IX secretion system membrane protein, partial [Chryseolinea sp.]|nr:PorP/SprF family type IX secretion system membrane protein [Chryseolinea sp.]